MINIDIKLDTIDKVYAFVATLTKYEYEVDVASGRYLVNGKSIMGLFSLDLILPVKLTIHAEKADDLVAELAPYLA